MDWTTSIILYVPLIVAIVLLFSCRIYPRLKVAILVTTTWHAVSLPWLDYFAQSIGLWQFSSSTSLIALPLSYYFSWVIWWGIVTTIILGKLPTKHARWWTLLLVIIVDVCTMPLPQPDLQLSSAWLLGEVLLIVLGFLPGLYLAHWTLSWSKVGCRSFLLSISFLLGPLFLSPFLAGHSIEEFLSKVYSHSHWEQVLSIAIAFIALTPAIVAISTFSKIGKGTPIPCDPPQQLVTTGIYSYLRNPIQVSSLLALLIWAIYAPFVVSYLMVIIGIIYCIGLARWSESIDMEERFGSRWQSYTSVVRPWIPRFFPAASDASFTAKLYIDFGCGPCSQIKQWLESKKLHHLELIDADEWPSDKPLQRITYVHPCGSINQGVSAVAWSLQHIHLGWAYMGWLMLTPGVAQILQLSMDASGASENQRKEASSTSENKTS